MAEAEVKEEKQEGVKVGRVTHYFTNISVAIIKLSGTLNSGDKIRIKGATSDFEQTVDSMQMEHKNVKEAKNGQSIGLKVEEHAREHDEVYKV
ncbi:translation elongation factor-like protein [Candidatus Woesearchaeota archaeon]|nr:translation elongation factor-like protein [Candidatus Woesearchaeota archaeon]